jgi:hypothetical protein
MEYLSPLEVMMKRIMNNSNKSMWEIDEVVCKLFIYNGMFG